MTWPVARQMSSHVPFYNDTWIFVWDLHTTRAALLDPGVSLFTTDRVFHPEGISLAFHTLAPFYGALALPFEPLLGLVATYNLFFLATFVASGLAARALALRLTASPGASFLAGFLYAFSPYHLAHAPHLNLLSLQFLPLTALGLLDLLEKASTRAALWVALSATLSFYCCLEYALASALLALVLLAHFLIARLRGPAPLAPLARLAPRALLSALVALLLVLPGLVPMLAEAAVERHYEDPVDWMFSADLFSWITPSVQHPLWGGYTMKIYQHFPGVLAEWTTYIGVTVAGLVLVALRGPRRAPLLAWLTVAVVFAVLAMGPTLRILGSPTSIPLPYRLLDALPLLSAMREPSRFAAVVTLATSMLAAFGFSALERTPRGARLVWLALPLAALEFLAAPLPMSSARTPAFYARLAADGEDYAVLDVPSELAYREHLYHQAVHGKRIFSGYIARIPEASRRWLDTLPLLRDPAEWELSSPRPGERAAGERFQKLARALDVRYALVHEELYRRLGRPEDFEPAIAQLLRVPGVRLVAREPGFAALSLGER